jgi:hypothetical protein
MVVANVLNATVRTASVGSELAFHEGLQKKSFEVKRVKIFAKIRIKSSGKIFAKIEWKDTSKNPTGSKNNSLSE